MGALNKTFGQLARGVFSLMWLSIGACATQPEPVESPITYPDYDLSQSCNIEGCCAGHGDHGVLQPDRIIMCADGTPSLICDCH